MPGHYGDKKKKGTKKGLSKGLAALAKKRPKVAAAIMKSTPYEEFKKQPSQVYKKKYIQLSLPLNHGVNET